MEHRPVNTTKAYNTYSKQYLEYCESKGFPKESHITAASFMKFSYDRGLRGRSTLSSVIPSAIADIFRYEGFNPCDATLVKQMKKTLKRLANNEQSKRCVNLSQVKQDL